MNYYLIKPFIFTNFYDLDTEYTLEELNKTIDFLKLINSLDEQSDKVKRILKFLKYNPDCIWLIINLIPLPQTIKLYERFGFLNNYWSKQLFEKLCHANNTNFIVSVLNKSKPLKHMINLKGHFNILYNFIKIENVWNNFKDKYNIINWDNFYIGQNLVLYLAHHKINFKKPIIKIYSSIPQKISIGGSFDVKNNQHVFEFTDFILLIDNKYYQSFEHIFIHTNENMLFYNNKIYCTNQMYLNLEKPLDKNLCLHNISNELKKNKYDTTKINTCHKKLGQNLFDKCYICSNFYTKNIIYEKYKSMCLECGKYNYEKRNLKTDLTDKKLFITGIRHKIGHCIALKVLRMGGHVIGTSRFPYFTIYNFSKESDYEEWKNRLIVCQIDFLDIKQITKLVEYLKDKDICAIINNACQTIRPSEEYKQKIIDLEKQLRLAINHETNEFNYSDKTDLIKFESNALTTISWDLVKVNQIINTHGIIFNQFKDIAVKKYDNSWHKKFEEIDEGEIMEATIINQVAPTLIINKLKPHLQTPSFIINVTAYEGQFYYNKTPNHAHTNMSKAAMCMLARTLHEEKNGCHVYAINPGFVSGVNPQHTDYPITDEDGAARILYPIIMYFNGKPLDPDICKMSNYKKDKW